VETRGNRRRNSRTTRCSGSHGRSPRARRVDTDLGGDAAHKKGIDTSVVQYQIKVGLIECPFAGLVDNRLARSRIEFCNNVVPRFATDEDPVHRTRSPDPQGRIAAGDFQWCRIRQIGPMALAGVDDRKPGLPRGPQYNLAGLNAARSRDTSLPRAAPNPSGSRKSRCISMMSSADRSRSIDTGAGSAYRVVSNGAVLQACVRCLT